MAPKTRVTQQKTPKIKRNKIVKKTTQKSTSKQVKHSRKAVISCRDCNRSFDNRFAYARHSLMVHLKHVKCPINECTRMLKSMSGLLNHFRTTHKNACSLCGHSNKNKSGLRVHLALVHDLKRCTCGIPRSERMKVYFD